MFTGIIETVGTVTEIEEQQENLTFTIESSLAGDLKIDQSLSHNGVCLTIIENNSKNYKVTAIRETLNKTNLKQLIKGDRINLERCVQVNSRLDGHIVQGHIDATTLVTDINDADGSWYFTFEIPAGTQPLIVDKGSICINGVSLTVVSPGENKFSVAIIPYTYEHTTFKNLKVGSIVNLEFDIIGKYLLNFYKVYSAN